MAPYLTVRRGARLASSYSRRFQEFWPRLRAIWVFGLVWLASLVFCSGTATVWAQPPTPPSPPGSMNFKVEVNTPAAPQAPPLAPNSAPNRPQAPAAPPVKSGANSPLPPEPPKLGRPAPVAAEPEPGKPLTPAEIEANKAKQAVFGELESWRQSIANTYGFNAVGVADPFMPVESVARPPDKAKAASQEAKPMIQQLALNQFSLSAIIVAENPSNNKALVDSGGKGYIITIGTLIGNNNGKVREITPTKVIIEEPESTYRASGKPRITEFRLSTVRDSENMELFLAE